MPVVRDTSHPAFPHGTARGVQRGCADRDTCPATPTCWEQRRKQIKRTQVARDRGLSSRVDPRQALAHVDRVKAAVDGSSDSAFERAAGLSVSTLHGMRSGQCCLPQTARKILQVTPALLAEHSEYVAVDRIRHLIRILQASGYPLRWQQEQSGVSNLSAMWIIRHTRNGQVRQLCSARSYATMRALYDRIGGREADPTRDGLTRRQIGMARRFGKDHGYYPVGAYDTDEHLTLNLRGWPGHPWQIADEKCGRMLDALRLSLNGATALATAAAVEMTESKVLQTRRAAGLIYEQNADDRSRRELSGKCAAAQAAIRRTLEAFDSGALGAAEACQWLGVACRTDVPADHPARTDALMPVAA